MVQEIIAEQIETYLLCFFHFDFVVFVVPNARAVHTQRNVPFFGVLRHRLETHQMGFRCVSSTSLKLTLRCGVRSDQAITMENMLNVCC